MKLLLAHILLHYDVKLRNGRPANVPTAQSNVPGDNAILSIKLRGGSEDEGVPTFG